MLLAGMRFVAHEKHISPPSNNGPRIRKALFKDYGGRLSTNLSFFETWYLRTTSLSIYNVRNCKAS